MRDEITPRVGQTGLLIVDVQERLLGAMPEATAATLVKSHRALIEMARTFGSPVYYTEQYPRGLGPTASGVLEHLEDCVHIEKTEFSAVANAAFQGEIMPALPADLIVTGIETHVCVLQTAVDLIKAGFRVFVPGDAVASRTDENRRNGLALMARVGAVVTNTETLLFNRLGKAEGADFKRLSRLIR